MKRNRIVYLALVGLTVLAGLSSRNFSDVLPSWVQLYLGDVLWALMVFFILGFIFRRKSTWWIAMVALAFSFLIEFIQLYHAEWIDVIRHTRVGGLIFGFGFLWSDLVCYSIGILAGVVFEKLFKGLNK